MPGIKDIVSMFGGGVMGGINDLISKFKADPTKVIELQADLEKLKITTEVEIQKLDVQLAEVHAKELETVNATMRAEAESEHWAQWLWRPMVGFTFSAILANNYILLPYLKKFGMEMIEIPSEAWMACLTILGVASAGRSFGGLISKKK